MFPYLLEAHSVLGNFDFQHKITMKTMKYIFCILVLCVNVSIKAEDIFPPFVKSTLKVNIPIKMIGYRHTPQSEIGTNAVYSINGQVFTNIADGILQTTIKGFSGKSNKTNPWETLTELLTVYQNGCDEKKLKALYDSKSQSFLTNMFTSKDISTSFKTFAASVTDMRVLIGFDCKNGFAVFVKVTSSDTTSSTMPFYFVKENGLYLVSTFENNEAMVSNIAVFLNTHTTAELFR